MSRLTEPSSVGFRDVDGPSLRIYYPALPPGGVNAPVVPLDSNQVSYRPVLFIHGQRETGEGGLCPPDITADHTRWGSVLELLGRCGFVVIAVNVSDTNFNPEAAAQDALEGLVWARESWDDRAVITEPPILVDPSRPPPLPRVGVIGHSWGAKAAADWLSTARFGALLMLLLSTRPGNMAERWKASTSSRPVNGASEGFRFKRKMAGVECRRNSAAK